MTAVALEAIGLRIRLGSTEVLRGVDLAVRAGSVLGVIGPSGAGKSTLFRLLVGELMPSGGTVQLLGGEVTRDPLWIRARKGLGYVPQTPSVLFDLTVADNLASFERAARVPLGSSTPQLHALGLEDKLSIRAKALSGGERRRLELLRALIGRPQVLICDEPLSGLDPVSISRVASLLRAHADQGAAVVLADHRIREILPLCDNAALLLDGRIELVAPPSTFADHEAVHRRYLTA